MKRSILVTVLAAVVLCSGCKALYYSEFTPEKDNNVDQLPPLVALIDTPSLEQIYGIYSTSTYGSANAKSMVIDGYAYAYGNAYSNSTTYRDSRISDVTNYFIDELNNNICKKYGESSGYAVCRIVNGYSYNAIGGWIMGSIVGFGLPYLLGMPTQSAKSALQVELSIYDRYSNLVGQYRSQFHSDRRYVAMYYGYSNARKALSKSNIEAFKMAMEDIKWQLRADFKRVNKILLYGF